MRLQSPLVNPRGLYWASSSFYCTLTINENMQSQVRLFADDTVVYLAVSSSQDSQVLQSDLDSPQYWERTWDMEFNHSKCQVLHVTRSRKPVMSIYFTHNQELEMVDTWTSARTWAGIIATSANRTLIFVKRNVQTKIKDIRTLAYILRLNMGQRSGSLTRKKIMKKLKWFKEWQPDGVKWLRYI